jgi:ubiquinone/menaquinone biosynthesis C-methylase UbiE
MSSVARLPLFGGIGKRGDQPMAMSFDRLAPHYRWMEWLLAGDKLQRCRTAFLDLIPMPEHALLLGEGHGRFLTALLQKHPDVRVTCLDASARMLDGTRNHLRKIGVNAGRVHWIHADISEWQPASMNFDLIVTNFFLDCFPAGQMEQIIHRLAGVSAPGARWLLADFREPPSGFAKWRARLVLATMYLFFRLMTHIPATKLAPPDSALLQSGFRLSERKTFEWGLLHADLWIRPPGNEKLCR